MKRSAWLAPVIAIVTSTTAMARTYDLTFTGSINAVQGATQGPTIGLGDAVSARFIFDEATAAGPTVLPIGGGFYSIYAAPLRQFELTTGSYSTNRSTVGSTVTYNDDAFGQDSIVFTIENLPYAAGFASIQFQSRGPTNAISGSGVANGVPLDRFATSFFAILNDGSQTARVYGDLAVVVNSAVPESSSWAMMILGFGCIGVALRCRARAAELIHG